LPFIGSFETSLILLLLMLFVFAAKRMESGVMLSKAATNVIDSSAAKEPSEGLVAEREESQEK
jgi:outer membrane biosynthesis protein TonB